MPSKLLNDYLHYRPLPLGLVRKEPKSINKIKTQNSNFKFSKCN